VIIKINGHSVGGFTNLRIYGTGFASCCMHEMPVDNCSLGPFVPSSWIPLKQKVAAGTMVNYVKKIEHTSATVLSFAGV
jgi:hypothetical protein